MGAKLMIGPRVVFVCGSLEPGRDGVGDYTRALAGELAGVHQSLAIAAIADPWVDEPTRSALDVAGADLVPTLRLPVAPGGYASRSGHRELRHWISEQDPDWLSLQLVPWSFEKRGIPLRLGSRLRNLQEDIPWHVMCHELWLDGSGGWRHHALGALQKTAIRRILSALSPQVIHVTLAHNASLLQGIGHDADRLPLFGNVPVVATHQSVPTRGRPLRLIFFGSPPPAEVRTRVLESLRRFVLRAGSLDVRVVGGADEPRRAFISDLLYHLVGTRAEVTDLGFLSPVEVSRVMASSDVGVVRNSGDMMGKSGTLISMLEHGLAVWAPVWGTEPADLSFRADRLFRSLDDAAAAPRARPKESREEVAMSFSSALSRK